MKKIEVWCNTNKIMEIDLGEKIYKRRRFSNEISLGDYQFILNNPTIKKMLTEMFPSQSKYLFSTLLTSIEDVRRIRNGSLHRSLTDQEKLQKIHEILFDSGVIENISRL